MASAVLSSEIDRQAARWLTLLELGAPTAAERRGFEAWIAADPAHRTAYDELVDIWRDSGELAELAALEPVTPPRQRGALAAFADRIREVSLPMRAAAAGLAAVMIATAVLLLQASSGIPGRYATQVAEIREVALADGSQVTLGPKSTLDVAFTEQERRVVLATGEAFFSVVGNPARPFVVVVDGTVVRVVGTQFNVHRGPEGVTVAVVEGTVEISEPTPTRAAPAQESPEPAPQRLTAGEQLVLGPTQAVAAIERVLPSRPGAWRAGRLIYENSSLRHVVADANRYSATPIVIAAAELEELPVFATFRTSQIAAMIQGLEDNLPITVDRTLPDRIVLRPNPDQDASP
ncbi:MAG: FecR domain-containing protein [Sphingomonadales bacterium]|nr:FecR domain-containing protein [Sphingomonadales bacterium]